MSRFTRLSSPRLNSRRSAYRLIQWRASSQRAVPRSSPSSARDGCLSVGATLRIVKEGPSRPLLLSFLRTAPYKGAVKKSQPTPGRPDIDAAVRGGDWTQAMDGEEIGEHTSELQSHVNI